MQLKRTHLCLGLGALVGINGCLTADHKHHLPSDAARYTVSGALERPADYREWVYVGTPLTPNDLNGGSAAFPEFHNVYIEPSAWEHFERTGDYPDGTMIAKELVSVGSKAAVSGKGYFMGDFLGLEVAVKSAEHHPDEPGNWAYFSFGHDYPLSSTATAFPTEACNSCHENSAAEDFVFSQYYPVLRSGQGPETKPGVAGARWDSDGRMLRPEGYRRWVYVGTPMTPNDLNGGQAAFPELHNVYVNPPAWKHWKATGEFPDGTVMIKELTSVGSKAAVSGKGYFMGEWTGLEAAVKDSRRFPDEPGHWAYFSFGVGPDAAPSAEAHPTQSCNGCHETSAADDFVFTQYYPVLTAAARAETEAQKTGASQVGATRPAPQSGSSTGASSSSAKVPPSESGALFEYLRGGEYKAFEARESSRHPSSGPHTRLGLPVRVFLNPTLADSLEAKNVAHPEGAAAIKEMYDADGALTGWAAMVKTDTDAGDGSDWYWYEVTSTTDGSDPVAAGNGIGLCVSCHTPGQDYVLTRFPLR